LLVGRSFACEVNQGFVGGVEDVEVLWDMMKTWIDGMHKMVAVSSS
jgi:hypothetical protein